jgi:hypothetical protein
MSTPFPFVAGQVLTAAQLNDIQNLPISDKTASYTLLVGDVTKRTIMNAAGATTITVDDAIFTVGDVIQVANKGAGTCTITAGAGVTINTSGSLALAQYGGGYLLALSASTFTFFNLGGGSAYGTATGGIGAPTAVTISGVDYEYLTFNSTGTLTNTKAGFFDYCAVGGGGGSVYINAGGYASGGGGAGQVVIGSIYLSANQTITIGAGGSVALYSATTPTQGGNTSVAATSPFTQTALGNIASTAQAGGDSATYVGGGVGSLNTRTSQAVTESTALGFRGGNSVSAITNAGGGGGQSARGGNGSSTTGGAGGAGFNVSAFIGGSELRKGMGGGGGGTGTGGAAATGGVAGSATTTPPNGNANSGGGGGGGNGEITTGNGGSGICYIRWVV